MATISRGDRKIKRIPLVTSTYDSTSYLKLFDSASGDNLGISKADFIASLVAGGLGGEVHTSAEVLAVGDWALSGGYYEYILTNVNIFEESEVTIIPDKEDVDIVLEAVVLPQTLVSDGQVIIYSVNLPTTDIDVELKVFNLNSTTATITNTYFPSGW